MDRSRCNPIVEALLYDGYLLYPHRLSSTKGRQQRLNRSGIYPQACSAAWNGAEPWMVQTECLLAGGPECRLSVLVRFLHLQDCRVQIEGQEGPPIQEAVEREAMIESLSVANLVDWPQLLTIEWLANRQVERNGNVLVIRQQRSIQGAVVIYAEHCEDRLFKLRILVQNLTPVEYAQGKNRDNALLQQLVSTHTILETHQGAFVSRIDPPERWRRQAADCQNIGTWPVLVGQPRQRDQLLSAPISLPDYPVAPAESAGDLFDDPEMDEFLTLRLLTLTDEQKHEMAARDERARSLLALGEAVTRDQLPQIRSWRPASTE